MNEIILPQSLKVKCEYLILIRDKKTLRDQSLDTHGRVGVGGGDLGDDGAGRQDLGDLYPHSGLVKLGTVQVTVHLDLH